jgi:hypothetical protein
MPRNTATSEPTAQPMTKDEIAAAEERVKTKVKKNQVGPFNKVFARNAAGEILDKDGNVCRHADGSLITDSDGKQIVFGTPAVLRDGIPLSAAKSRIATDKEGHAVLNDNGVPLKVVGNFGKDKGIARPVLGDSGTLKKFKHTPADRKGWIPMTPAEASKYEEEGVLAAYDANEGLGWVNRLGYLPPTGGSEEHRKIAAWLLDNNPELFNKAKEAVTEKAAV